MTHAGIVLAAGSGTRVGNSRNKVYLPLAGRRIVTWSLELFRRLPGIGRLVLVVRDEDRELAAEVLDRELPGVPVDLVIGGQTRHESEYRALLHLADEIRDGEIDVVLVHDAARPLAPVKIVEEVLGTAIRTGSAIPALPLEDAVGVDEAGRLSHSGRSDMVRVQTPQAFKGGPLLAAYQAAAADGFTGTDTAACVERYEGIPVQVVTGDPRNIKVTYAGRLLASTVCSNCGHRIAKDLAGLRRAYLADVEHRVRTKPRRMLRRVIRHPVAFALDLPGALLVKPAKMEAELRVLYGRR